MDVIQLYLDEDVRPLLAAVLRDRGYDVLTTAEAGMIGRSDAEQLDFATSQGRVLFTHNVRDYMRLSQEYSRTGRSHAGLILAPQMPFKELLRLTLRLLTQIGTEPFIDRVQWLTHLRA
jgi:predicted nuclease of predicted toxin-antitoxin system